MYGDWLQNFEFDWWWLWVKRCLECQPVTLSNEQPTKEWVSASARTAERPAAQNGTHGKDKKNKEKTLCAVSLPMSESWCYPAGGLKTGRIQQRSGSYLEVMKTQQTESSVAVYPVRRQCPRFQASGYTEAVQSWLRPGSSRIPRLGGRANALCSVIVSTADIAFILSLLTVTVTLSLGRPHGSYMDARPGAHVGIKVNARNPSHPTQIQSWRRKKGRKGKREKRKKGREKGLKLWKRKLVIYL